MADQLKILLFIPARNEAEKIGEVIAANKEQIERAGHEVSVLVIDDGSEDQTAQIAKEAGAEVLRHKEHAGLGVIFQEAVRYAIEKDFDIMLTTDGDGQFSALDVHELLKPVVAGEAHLAAGSRFCDGGKVEGISKIKLWGNRQMSRIVSWILGKKFRDVSCGFRAFSREALLNLNLSGQFTYTQEVFLNLGFKKLRIAEIPVTVTYFPARRSRIAANLWNYGLQTVKIIFKSIIYYRPMKFFGGLSALCFIVGLPILLVLGVRFMITDMVSPHKALGIFSLVLTIMGCLFFITGVLLQLISRIQMNLDKILYYERKRSR